MKLLLFRLAIVFAIYFALQGGEYSTYDLFRQRQRERMLLQMVDSLEHDVDSLKTLKGFSTPILRRRSASRARISA